MSFYGTVPLISYLRNPLIVKLIVFGTHRAVYPSEILKQFGKGEDYMAQETVEQFFGRLLTDPVFRENAGKQFHKTCLDAGFILTKAERHLISRVDLNKFEALSAEIDGGLKRCGLNEYTSA